MALTSFFPPDLPSAAVDVLDPVVGPEPGGGVGIPKPAIDRRAVGRDQSCDVAFISSRRSRAA